MKVLVTGGAGYIGSHTVLALTERGHTPVIVDNFDNSSPAAVGRLEEICGQSFELHAIDVSDKPAMRTVFESAEIDAVIHFAGLKAVGESVAFPLRYYRTNLTTALTLLDVMDEFSVRRLVFSSSSTVYPESNSVPYVEAADVLQSGNPYGWSKVMIEQIINDWGAANSGARAALLRYFNVAGADSSGRIGEDPRGTPNNLSPYIAQVAVGRLPQLSIFGTDYPTADGTCERDYIHVSDLADAHVAAVEHLDKMETPVRAFNVGTGKPFSVWEMLQGFERAANRSIPHKVVARRPGDRPVSVADVSRITDEMGWRASRTLDDICRDTWAWQSSNPHGYETT